LVIEFGQHQDVGHVLLRYLVALPAFALEVQILLEQCPPCIWVHVLGLLRGGYLVVFADGSETLDDEFISGYIVEIRRIGTTAMIDPRCSLE